MRVKTNKVRGEKVGFRGGSVCTVNTNLLPLKIFNFFYFGAVGSVIPFLTVYLQHLSLTAPETGVVTGVSVLVAFLVRPVLGLLADWFQSRRLLLAVCCLLFGVAFCSMWFLPVRTLPGHQTTTLSCRPTANSDERASRLFQSSEDTLLCFLSSSLRPGTSSTTYFIVLRSDAMDGDGETSETVLKMLDDDLSYPESGNVDQEVLTEATMKPDGEVIVSFKNANFQGLLKNVSNVSSVTIHLTCLAAQFSQSDNEGGPFSEMALNTLAPYRSIDEGSLAQNTSPDHPNMQLQRKHTNQKFFNFTHTNSQLLTDLQSHYSCTWETNPANPAFTFDLIFFLSLTFISIARSFYSSANSLSDTVTYGLLGANRYQWGRQRLFGTLGTATVALVFTTVNDRLTGGGFSALFVTCSCLIVLTCATVFFLRAHDADTIVPDSQGTTTGLQNTAQDNQKTTDDTQNATRDTQDMMKYTENTTEDTVNTTRDTLNRTKDTQFTIEDTLHTSKDTLDTVENTLDTTKDTQNTNEDNPETTDDTTNTTKTSQSNTKDIQSNTNLTPTTTTNHHHNTNSNNNINNTSNNNNSHTAKPPRPQILKNLRRLLGETAVKIFLFKILVLGMFCGSAQNFIFWFLRDLGSGQTVLGACLLVNCVSTVVILRFAAVIIKRLGETKTMYLALPAYVLRFVLVSLMTEPWLAVPIEVFHGVTYSLLWAAASACTQVLAPPGTHATCQAIAGAIYWDMGRGLGSLLTGQLYRAIGGRWTFRAYGVTAALMLPLCILLDKRWPLLHDDRVVSDRGQTPDTDSQASDGDVEAQPLKGTPQSSLEKFT